MRPTVSVVIPVRSAPDHLPRALASIQDQTYPHILDIVIADADSSAIEFGDPRVIVIANPSGTTPAGLNLAISASRGDVIVRCDAHSTLPPDYIETAVSILEDTGADNVGGMQVPVGETVWSRAIAAAMTSPWGAGDARYRIGGDPGPAETVYLGVFRREALQRVGGFDEEFVRTQDYELNHRIIASGGLVWFDPRLAVTYRPRGSLGALARQYLDYGKAKRRFNRKHPRSLRWRQLVAPALVIVLGASLVASIFWPWALALPAAYLLGLLGVGVTSKASTVRLAAALATMHLSWGWGFLTETDR